MFKKLKLNRGFTLIELLVVIGIIAILAAIVIVAINPEKRFKEARNAQRMANVNAILGAIQQNMIDNKGITTCTIPTTPDNISSATDDINLAPCLAAYLAILPVDPETGSWTNATNYDTQYEVSQDATTKQVTVSAPDAEGVTISVTR